MYGYGTIKGHEIYDIAFSNTEDPSARAVWAISLSVAGDEPLDNSLTIFDFSGHVTATS
jgi:hypothetical protein